MKTIFSIAKKELKAFIVMPAYLLFTLFFLMLSSWIYLQTFFIAEQASMRSFFSILPWIYLFFIPAITMRVWAEEKKNGTIETLLTFPVKDYQIVIGKYLAIFIFMIFNLFLTLIIPLVLFSIYDLGDPDSGVIYTSYLGAMLLSASLASLGVYISSLTENQILAFIISLSLCFVLIILGNNIVLLTIPESWVSVVRFININSHYEGLLRGVIDTRDLVYFLSFIFFFLFLNYQNIVSRKWK